MKNVFIVKGSEDGIMGDAYTNTKALFNYLSTLNYGIDFIGYTKKDSKVFNYPNLLKQIKNSIKTGIDVSITCRFDGNITIMVMNLVSK